MSGVPDKYKRFNTQQTKQLCIAVKIDGVPDVLTSAPLNARVKYGDPIHYGDPGLVYGGLRPYLNSDGSTYRALLSLKGSSTALSQKLESESGRASISNITLAFVDQNGYMTSLFTPGVVVNEIMGRAAVMYVGYAETAYPDDYLIMFRGTITSIDVSGGIGTLQISDPNIKRKQELFFSQKRSLSATLLAATTTVNMFSMPELAPPAQPVLPNSYVDPAISFYFQIDNEWIGAAISYSSLPNITLTRGARGTVAADHAAGAAVSGAVSVSGFAIDLALRIMISGSSDGDTWASLIPLYSIGDYPDTTPGVTTTSKIILGTGLDAIRDYNLTVGDWVYIADGNSGLTNPWQPHRVVTIGDPGTDSNRVITIDTTLTKQLPTSGPITATMGIRSQYDTFPSACGSGLNPTDVDIAGHLFLGSTFQSVGNTQYSFFLTATESNGKEFLETEIYRPIGLFSLTRRGQCSVGISKPPIADENLVVLSEDNVINPGNIKPSRQINGRTFYNDVDFSYDADDSGNFQQIYRTLDSDSLNDIGIFSPLVIESNGLKSATTTTQTLDRISAYILSRYKRGMVTFPISVQWGTGNLIEAGDTVAVKDGGALQIPNFFSSDRYFGTRLFEVLSRTLDIPGGKVDLILASGVGAEATDRFATIAPSSVVAAGSTTTRVVIQDSYGAIFPDNEQGKWTQYLGQLVTFHSQDWSYSETVTLTAFDPNFPYIAIVDPALSVAPSAGIIIDLAAYPQTSDPNSDEIIKQVHAFLDRSAPVLSGSSDIAFTISTADAAFVKVGQYVRVHNDDYTSDSLDQKVIAVDTSTGLITLKTAIGFTPDSTMHCELLGFDDGAGAYRFI